MRRVMYVFLPDWPIDRLRRSSRASSCAPGLRPSAPDREGPFATIVATRGRRLLAAVNPAAAAAGLVPGMPLADALSFVPELRTASAEPAADAASLTRLAGWCGRYSPWTAPDGADGVKIEITGCAHLWGGENRLAADLARRLARQGIAHRVAIAGTPGAASALARFAAEAGRPALPGPGEERSALAPLPVAALRLDPAIVADLRRVGLRRIGDLYPMPREALARRFGEVVPLRLDQALGAVAEPLSPLREALLRQVRLSFAEPIAAPADLVRAIDRLATELAARLERDGDGARRIELAFRRVDGRIEHIRVGTARPSREARHLAGLLAAKLETVDPGPGVEDMALALLVTERLAPEQIRISPLPPTRGEEEILPTQNWCDTASLLDRLGVRFGLDAIGRIAARESHIPERASLFIPIGGNSRPEWGRGRAGLGARSKPPRPIRLFVPPEPIEAAWMLPDEPPFRFTWRRRAYRVRCADGPERIADEWWAEEGWAEKWWTASGAAAAVSAGALRDYYRVEDEEGRRFWLFRAGLPGKPPPRWFVHGVFA